MTGRRDREGETASIAAVMQSSGSSVGMSLRVDRSLGFQLLRQRQQRGRKVEEAIEIVNEERYVAFFCW